MTDDLVTWLRAQLDADEAAARATGTHLDWQDDHGGAGSGVDRKGVDDYSEAVVVYVGEVEEHDARHIARHDPASVLRDIAAKRAIVDLHGPELPICEDGYRPGATHADVARSVLANGAPAGVPCLTLRLLASAYSHRDGYRPEWAPTP